MPKRDGDVVKLVKTLCRLIMKAEVGTTYVEDGYFVAFLEDKKKNVHLHFGKAFEGLEGVLQVKKWTKPSTPR